eukprot:EC791059.1.p3 GENE.EC791059.1~~EC791059.1.p3  ORF type:complete len:80 (+),score=14.38 EC791059.1:116-355(+)
MSFSVHVSAAHDSSLSAVVEGMSAMSTLADLLREATRLLREKSGDEGVEMWEWRSQCRMMSLSWVVFRLLDLALMHLLI